MVVEYERLTEDRILRRHGIFELHRRRANNDRSRLSSSALEAVDRGSHAVRHPDWETSYTMVEARDDFEVIGATMHAFVSETTKQSDSVC